MIFFFFTRNRVQCVRAIVAKSDDFSVYVQNAQGGKGELTPAACPQPLPLYYLACVCLHSHINIILMWWRE